MGVVLTTSMLGNSNTVAGLAAMAVFTIAPRPVISNKPVQKRVFFLVIFFNLF